MDPATTAYVLGLATGVSLGIPVGLLLAAVLARLDRDRDGRGG